MTGSTRSLADRWVEVLRDRLGGEGERALQRAYHLGRDALASGLGLLDLSAAHQDALGAVLGEGDAASERARRAAKEVLAEGLAPFEMTHLGHVEAVAALRRINEALEAEARRIAHALHDESAQLLVRAHLAIDDVARGMPPEGRDRLDAIRAPLVEIERQLRRLAHELRPTILDDLGLVPAVDYLAKGIASRGGITIRVEGDTGGRLPQTVETALYRVVQEALWNVLRHANAQHARIRFEREPRTIRCTVQDDGTGFDVRTRPRNTGLGLVGMRERVRAVGGALEIRSDAGRGVEIRVVVPLEET